MCIDAVVARRRRPVDFDSDREVFFDLIKAMCEAQRFNSALDVAFDWRAFASHKSHQYQFLRYILTACSTAIDLGSHILISES